MTETAQSPTAEEAALGSPFIRPSSFAEIAAILTSDDFSSPANRAVFEAMTSLTKRGVPIDPLTVEDEMSTSGHKLQLEGGAGAYLMRLANAVPTAENCAHYANQVAREAGHRRLALLCSELPALAKAEPEMAQKLLLDAQKLMTELVRGRFRSAVDISDLIEPLLKEFEERQQARKNGPSKVLGLSSGVKALDYLTGGFQRGGLHIIGARPSIGKTALGCQAALTNALDGGVPALIFSLEMRPAELAERFVARVGKVNSFHLRSGEITSADWQGIYAAGARMHAPGAIKISEARNIGEILTEARAFRVRNANHPDLYVLVDYLQMVRNPSGFKGQNRESQVAEISRELKSLAKDIDCAVVAPAQLNRDNEKAEAEPKMTDLRESGAIENDADTILLLHRTRKDPHGPVLIKVEKNRLGGQTGDVQAEWHGPTYEFRDPQDQPSIRASEPNDGSGRKDWQ